MAADAGKAEKRSRHLKGQRQQELVAQRFLSTQSLAIRRCILSAAAGLKQVQDRGLYSHLFLDICFSLRLDLLNLVPHCKRKEVPQEPQRSSSDEAFALF